MPMDDDAADRQHGGHGHRIETSLLPLKKRASNYSSGAGRISAGNPYSSSSKKTKKRVDDVVGAETKDTAGACLEVPVPRQRRSVPAAASREWESAAPTAASPEPAADGNAAAAALSESDEDKKKRLKKGKWLATSSSSLQVTPLAPQPPPVKKLMHDGIRSFIPPQLRAAAAVAPPQHGRSPALSAALEWRLEELGATKPWLVLSKVLRKSDVDVNQNRLLVSCKRGRGRESSPITRCFTAAELRRVNTKLAGLFVTAFDRDGFPYALTCKFLESNNGYRFINQWKEFLVNNGMDLGSQREKAWKRDVEVELWAFRSCRLPFQPQLDAEGNVVTARVSRHLHADGALGLLLLHHEKMRRVVKSEEEEEDDWKQRPSPSSPSVARKKKGKQQSGKRKRGALAAPVPVALPAPVLEQELLFCAAVGLEKLRQSISRQWQEYVDRGHGAKGLSNDVATSSVDVEEEKINKKQKTPATHSTKQRDC